MGPIALVDFEGIRYAMPAGACGIPVTLYLYPDRIPIETSGGRFQPTHPRFPRVGKVSYVPGERAEQLATMARARRRLYFQRERVLELGPVGESYLTELIHARPHTWKGAYVERLFALLDELGEGPFLQLLQRALFQRLYGTEYVVALADPRGSVLSPQPPMDDLGAMLRRLHLPTTRRLYPELVLRAEEEMGYRTFLEILFAEEIAHRAQTRVTRSVGKAGFPFLRTIEEFDFTFRTSVRLKMLGSLLGPELVSEARSVVLSGPPGREKTRCARTDGEFVQKRRCSGSQEVG